MKYKIEITETLQRIVEIEAESVAEALIEAEVAYRNEKIWLDESDLVDTEFKELI